jgi:hypothetical protein
LYAYTVLESAVDWLTLTTKTEPATERLQNVATQFARKVEECGNILTAWGVLGYQGWKCGTIAFGRNATGGMMVLSGPDAETVFPHSMTPDVNCTRLDIQVTVRIHPENNLVAHESYAAIIATKPQARRFVTATLLQGSDGGGTCYVGRRASETFGRIYNKRIESGDPDYQGCWRYEVEYKRDAANHIARLLPAGAERSAAILNFVHRHYSERGVVPPWRPDGKYSPGIPRRTASDTERRLRWLREQVAPSVAALRKLGYIDQVLDSLGLRDTLDADALMLADPRFGSHAPLE